MVVNPDIIQDAVVEILVLACPVTECEISAAPRIISRHALGVELAVDVDLLQVRHAVIDKGDMVPGVCRERGTADDIVRQTACREQLVGDDLVLDVDLELIDRAEEPSSFLYVRRVQPEHDRTSKRRHKICELHRIVLAIEEQSVVHHPGYDHGPLNGTIQTAHGVRPVLIERPVMNEAPSGRPDREH